MKPCLPRKAGSLAKSQLSVACARQIDERGRGRAGCILPQEAGRMGLCRGTKIFQGPEEAGCAGGEGAASSLRDGRGRATMPAPR